LIQSNGNVFGGYTQTGWNGNLGKISDANAFLFSYQSSKGYKQKIFKRKQASGALFNCSHAFCYFGGATLYINAHGLTGVSATRNNVQYWEACPFDFYLTGGSRDFPVDELEVHAH